MNKNLVEYLVTAFITIIVLNLMTFPNRALTVGLPVMVISYFIWKESKFGDYLLVVITTFFLYSLWFRVSHSVSYNLTTLIVVPQESMYYAALRSVPQTGFAVSLVLYHLHKKKENSK